MKTIINYLLKESQHEKEQKALGRFIADIPGISDLPTGHVPQLNDALFFQNKDIYISKHSRYAKYPEHSHNFLELNYMVHGTCQQVINGELITLNAGDLLLMDVDSIHSIHALNEEDIMCNILFQNNHVSIEWLNQLKSRNSLLYQTLLNQTNSNQTKGQFAIIRSQGESSQINHILEQILTEYFLPRDFSEAIIQQYLPILFYEMARNLPEIEKDSFEGHSPYLQVLNLIDTQYQKLTLNEAAIQLNFNKNYLSNLIKEKSGKTFTELINQKKLQKAQLLIQSTRLPINEISNIVGFSNRTYFYREYLNFFGHKPGNDR